MSSPYEGLGVSLDAKIIPPRTSIMSKNNDKEIMDRTIWLLRLFFCIFLLYMALFKKQDNAVCYNNRYEKSEITLG